LGIGELILVFIILDNPDIFIDACYVALPSVAVRTTFPGPKLLNNLFSFDFSHYVAWYRTWLRGAGVGDIEIAVTFFTWMKLKVCFAFKPHLMDCSSQVGAP